MTRALQALQRFQRSGGAATQASSGLKRCELCALTIARQHQHLIDPTTRNLLCACDACAILFDSGGLTRYKRVPRDVKRIEDGLLTGEAWEKLLIPISLAFLYRSSHARRIVALYPSPGGVTESQLEFSAPALAFLREDIEGLLVNRLRGRQEVYIAPMDRCFELVGLLRVHWRGFTGGDRAWEEVEKFFTRLQQEIPA